VFFVRSFAPAMPAQPPGDRSLILACSVRSLREYVLRAQCGCGRTVSMRRCQGRMSATGWVVPLVDDEGERDP
jgi:hypothetical protein